MSRSRSGSRFTLLGLARSRSGPGRRSRAQILLVASVFLALFMTGCSKGGPSAGPTKTANPSPAATESTPSSSGTGVASAGGTPTYDVYVKNFTYHGMPSTVPANTPFLVSFTNKESFAITHEFVVLKLPQGKTVDDVVADAKKKGDKGEDDWIHMGDSGDVETGGSSVITLDLPPGNYVATCWQTGKAGGGEGPPHVAIGMHTEFTATSSASAPTATNIPTYDVYVKNFTYHGMPSTVPANTPFRVRFTNEESFSITHEFVALSLPKGKTVDDVVADAKKKGDKGEDDWVHVGDSGDVETGGTATFTLDLAPGDYVATCWQTGKAGGGEGPPHVAIGMHTSFTATSSASVSSAQASPSYDVNVKNFTYHGMPSTVPADTAFTVSFTNDESFSITHEFVVLKLPQGKTVDDVVADAKKKGDKGEDDWIHMGDSGDVETGGSSVITLDLPPGNYVATCWQTGKAGGGEGPPHVAIGMHTEFTAQ